MTARQFITIAAAVRLFLSRSTASQNTRRQFAKFCRFQSVILTKLTLLRRPIIVPALLFASTSNSTPQNMEAVNLEDILRQSDQFFDENQFQEAFDALAKYEPQNLAEIKWRQSRALYSLSKTADKDRKADLIRQSYDYVKEGLAINDKDFAVHKWMAILLDAYSELDGIKARVSELNNVKKHMQLAVDLNPEDSTSWYLLGSFAFGLADMAWYQRKIVSAIFATPPSGSYEEALKYFERAETNQPNFYSMNHLMLGKCYQALKNLEKAKEFLTKAANCHVLNEDDKKCKEEASVLLKKF